MNKACPDAGRCHGSLCWCAICGDVSLLCLDLKCDLHRARWTAELAAKREADIDAMRADRVALDTLRASIGEWVKTVRHAQEIIFKGKYVDVAWELLDDLGDEMGRAK